MTSAKFTRRQFTAMAATLAGTRFAAGEAAPARDLIRVGILGCRNRGHQVARTFNASGRFHVRTLCDCDAAMLAEAAGRLKHLPATPQQVKDFRRVLDDPEIDAIVVATPDHWHALMTMMALEAGKHVYVEKPVSYNLSDGKAMVAAQRRHPKQVVAVGTQQRSAPHFKEAKAFIASGGLGKIAFARAWIGLDRGVLPVIPDAEPPETLDYDLWVGPAPMRPYNENRLHYNWHFMRDYGTGDMGNWGAHWLDIVRWYLDLDVPKSVTALGGRYMHRDAKEWPDTQTVLYEFPDLTVLWELRLWTRFFPNEAGTGAEFGGDKGSMVITRGGWTVYPKDGKPVKHPGSEMEMPHALNFADAIAGRAKPAADIAEGHKTAVMIHLGNIAAMIGRHLRLDAATETIEGDAEANQHASREYRSPWRLPT